MAPGYTQHYGFPAATAGAHTRIHQEIQEV